jgi:hypothetical protein
MPYNPPTKVTTRSFPYLALVTQADPMWQRRKHREVEYEFAGKVFFADPYVRGSYNHFSNVYQVGQQQGAIDPKLVAASPMIQAQPVGGWA